MIPERTVWSPIAEILTRRLPPLTTVPAMTLEPATFGSGLDSPVIMDSSTSAAPSTTVPSAGTRAPGLTRTMSPTQLREWNRLSFCAPYAFSGVREQGGECVQRATSLENVSHFEPVAEDHHRNQ